MFLPPLLSTQYSLLSTSQVPAPLAFTSPIILEFFSGWIALAVFVGLALPIVFFGMRSLSGLGPIRKWVAIGLRLAVILLTILILGGIRWQRVHKDVQVVALVDVSPSVLRQFKAFPDKSYIESVENDLVGLTKDPNKKRGDTIGKISFQETALIDAMPDTTLHLDARAVARQGTGTDAAAAINLALATMSKDAMHRLLLYWDGNSTQGDIESAINAAASQQVPIDVVPLSYKVDNEVMLERFVAPNWKRENEPFTIDVILRSTNVLPVTGTLNVIHQGEPMDLDPSTPGVQPSRKVTLKNGLNVEHVRVPPLNGGVHQFRAVFDADGVTTEINGQQVKSGDTNTDNNVGTVFTFVRGKGQILYVDNASGGDGAAGAGSPGDYLRQALEQELASGKGGTEKAVKVIGIDGFPNNTVELQNYDAIVLANVPMGAGGLSPIQDKMLRSYVQDMGGGLVVIGGPDTFGAGGWQSSELQKALPVDMEIPAQRQVGKGALVLVMHSCEFNNGNYWGEQCALKAVETLGEKDEVGVITYGWTGAGSIWDYQLADKGDGSRVNTAIKKMQVGDMPSFDDSMNLALNGKNGGYCLARSDARHKHVIIISDGDPQAPSPNLVAQYQANKVSVSTVSVYPHMGGAAGNSQLPPTMETIAKDLKGKAYGPIMGNFGQLPQIFIKEATVVRRSLIHEDAKGIPITVTDPSDEMIKGFSDFPKIYGLVLTSKKNDPRVEMPLAVGKNNDPVLAHWQTGLGQAAVFTPDAHNKWGKDWVGWGGYAKFYAQMIRKVSRPPMSADYDVAVKQTPDGKGKITVEAMDKEGGAQNFLSIAGTIVGPDMKEKKVRLTQTGPGIYEAEFEARDAGNYVVAMNSRGRDGKAALLLGGMASNTSPEMRDLRSNDALLKRIATATNGRFVEPASAFDPNALSLFTREGLKQTASPMPVWDILIPFLLGLILLDVAVRRIAWDWLSTKRLGEAAVARIRSFTLTRQVETRDSLDALKRVREEVAESKFRTEGGTGTPPKLPTMAGSGRPDPKAKFTTRQGVEGDISSVVGGATDKPIPPPPKKIQPKGGTGGEGHMGGLMAAKKRAQQQIKDKEQGDANG